MPARLIVISARSLRIRRVPRMLGMLLLPLVLSTEVAAQNPGSVQGAVTDPVGQAVAGVRVTVLGTALLAETDEEGHYLIGGIPPGLYTLEASPPADLTTVGDWTVERRAVRSDTVRVLGGGTVTVNFQLLLGRPALFSDSAPVVQFDPDTLARVLPYGDSAVRRVSQVQLKSQVGFAPWMTAPGATLTLNLFRDEGSRPALQLETVATRVRRVGADGFRWSGSVVGVAGSLVTLVVRDSMVSGTIHVNGRVFQIRPLEGGLHVVVELDPGVLSRWGPPDTFPRPPERREILSNTLPPGRDGACDVYVESAPIIGVLVLYTPAAQSYVMSNGVAFGDVEGMILEAVDQTNQLYELSGIDQRVELVHMAPTLGYDEGPVLLSAKEHLNALRDPVNGPQNVATLRVQYHADIVVLWLSPNVGGGQAFLMEQLDPAMADTAFAAVNGKDATASFQFTHELGHVMGARHERAADPTPFSPFVYNHGYFDAVTNEFSILAGCPLGAASCTRGSWFSNADLLSPGGSQRGRPSTASDAADNRKTLNNSAPIVAAFAMTPVWYLSAGGVGPWKELRADDARLTDVRFGDFNGDAEDDVFDVDPASGIWRVSYSGTEEWVEIATGMGGYDVSELALGHFDSDGKTDVLRVEPTSGGGNDWRVWLSSQPLAGWQTLHSGVGSDALQALRFGDFDGNGSTDVFRVNATGVWQVWFGGASAWADVGPTAQGGGVDALAFGEFDAVKGTDVMRVENLAGQRMWVAYSAGAGPPKSVNRQLPNDEPATVWSQYRYGDFNGDGVTDVLRMSPDDAWWEVSYGPKPPGQNYSRWAPFRRSCFSLSEVGVGDFNGDRRSDVFRPGKRP